MSVLNFSAPGDLSTKAGVKSIIEQIAEREGALAALVPQWEAHRARENEGKKRLDEARTRLEALHGKKAG